MNLAQEFISDYSNLSTLRGAAERIRTVFESAVRDRLMLLRGAGELPGHIGVEAEGRLSVEYAALWFNRCVALQLLYQRRAVPCNPFPAFPRAGPPELVLYARKDPGALGVDTATFKRLDFERGENEALYHYLLVSLSRTLAGALPVLFKDVTGLDALLLPGNLMSPTGMLAKFVHELPPQCFAEHSETIGWLYQFYSQSGRSRLSAGAMPSGELGPSTQLYTPDWIATLLAENALAPTLSQQPLPELTLLDPACGSGHILLAAYRTLRTAYRRAGFKSDEIPRLILSRNLFGMDIDARAVQLASLTLLGEALLDDPGILANPPPMRLTAFPTARELQVVSEAYHAEIKSADRPWLRALIEFGQETSKVGTLARVPPDNAEIVGAFERFARSVPPTNELKTLRRVAVQMQMLSSSYSCLLANPPYLSSRFMDDALRRFARRFYPNSKRDLYAMFLECGMRLLQPHGNAAFITMHGWMFLPSFEQFRRWILREARLRQVYHLGSHAFESIGGEVVQTSVLVLSKLHHGSEEIRFFDLRSGSAAEKKAALEKKVYPAVSCKASDFDKLPRAALSYWTSEDVRKLFVSAKPLESYLEIRQGVATGDNRRFLRRWYEVARESICFKASSFSDLPLPDARWFPYNKGGRGLRWYGNHEHVIRLDSESIRALSISGNRLPSRHYFFRPGITWSLISSGGLRARKLPAGFVSDVNGMTAYSEASVDTLPLDLALGFMATGLCEELLRAINPTLATQAGDMKQLPLPKEKLLANQSEIEGMVQRAVILSKERWDDDELSWDFRRSPLLAREVTGRDFKGAVERYLAHYSAREAELLRLEHDLDQIVSVACGVELPEQVSEPTMPSASDIAVAFLSFVVGHCFNRYQEPDLPASRSPVFIVSDTGGTCEEGWAVVERYLKACWPKRSEVVQVSELASMLPHCGGRLGREAVKFYLQRHFFQAHHRHFKKRPIYWLVTSGRCGSFACFIPMHKIGSGIFEQVRRHYVEPFKEGIERDHHLAHDLPALRRWGRRTVLEELDGFVNNLERARMLEAKIDLDDGVVVNYAKLAFILAALPS